MFDIHSCQNGIKIDFGINTSDFPGKSGKDVGYSRRKSQMIKNNIETDSKFWNWAQRIPVVLCRGVFEVSRQWLRQNALLRLASLSSGHQVSTHPYICCEADNWCAVTEFY